MKKELAQRQRPRRVRDASAPAAKLPALASAPDAPFRTVAPTPHEAAHAAVGNAALAARTPFPRTPADPQRMQSAYGNAAVQRAARAGEVGPFSSSPSNAPQATTLPEGASNTSAPTVAPDEAMAEPSLFDAGALPLLAPLFPFMPLVPLAPFAALAPFRGLLPTGLSRDTEAKASPVTVGEKEKDGAGKEREEARKKTEKDAAETKKEGEKLLGAEQPAGAPVKPSGEKTEKEKTTENPVGAEGAEGPGAEPSKLVADAEKKTDQPPAGVAKGPEATAGPKGVESPQKGAEEIAAGGAGASQAAGGAAGVSGVPEMAEWQGKVTNATHAIKTPDPGATAGGGGRAVHTAGKGAVMSGRAAQKKVRKEAVEVVKAPDPPPDPLLSLGQNPVPDATDLVIKSSDQKLPNQELPPLTPIGNIIPTPLQPLSADHSTKVTTAADLELDAKEAAAKTAGDDKELARIRKSRKVRARKLKEAERKGQAEPLVLVDETGPAPAPPAPLTKETQTDVGKVLATLAQYPEQGAQQIVMDARREAYPNKVLIDDHYNDFEADVLPAVKTYFGEKIISIAEQAGLTKEDVDRFVAERRTQQEELFKKAVNFIAGSEWAERIKVKDTWQETADKVKGQREAMAEEARKKREEMSVYGDAGPIFKQRELLVRAVSKKVAQQSIGYTQAGDRRAKALDDMGKAMGASYTAAVRKEVEAQVAKYVKAAKKARKDTVAAKAEAEQLTEPLGYELLKRINEVNESVGKLKTTAKETAGRFDREVKSAGRRAIDMIGDWAERQGAVKKRTWFENDERDIDWEIQAEETAAAWEAARTAEARDGLVRDLNTLRELKDIETGKIDQQHAFGGAALTEQQSSVINDYYKEGPGKGDAILTVAQRLQARLSAGHRADLIKTLQSKVEKLPKERWHDVEFVAYEGRKKTSPEGSRDDKGAFWIASQVRNATNRIGTDEDKIYDAFASLTPLLARATRLCYTAKGWGDLDAELDDELSGAEYKRAMALLEGSQSRAGAAAIRYAVLPGAAGHGNVDTVMQALRSAPAAEIREQFKTDYGVDLDVYLKQSLKSIDYERAQAYMAGDTARAYALELEKSVSGEDRKGVEAVYTQIRSEVEAEGDKQGWNTKQIETAIKERAAKVEDIYNKGRGAEKKDLRADLGKEFSGASRDLVLALHDNDQSAADVARLALEDKAFLFSHPHGYGKPQYVGGDPKAIKKLLKAQGERARREVERDANIEIKAEYKKFAERQEVALLLGRQPEPMEKWEAKEKELRGKIETDTQERAKGYMGKLKEGYEKTHIFPGSFEAMLDRNVTKDSDREMVRNLVDQFGFLKPEQEVHYAVIDEDADAVKSFLDGKSAAEIKTIADAWGSKSPGKEWLKNHPGKTFNDYILSEFDGRDENDIKLRLEGEPQTLEQKIARKRKEVEYERKAYGWAAGRTPEEMKRLKEQFPGMAFAEEGETDLELRNMEEELALLEDQYARVQKYPAGSEQYEVAYARFKLQSSNVSQSVDNYRTAIDSVTDRAAMIAGIIATAIVIVATAGMAAPLVAAAAAAAGAAATVATKWAMKGDAYTRDEMMTDIVVGAVDAVVSAATAGLGGKLLKLGFLAKMANSTKVAPRLIAHGLAEGAENFIASVPSAFVAAAMDKRSQGISFGDIFSGAALGAALGGGLGMLGGLKRPKVKLPDSGDILAHRGTPAERLAGWQSFQKSNPGKSYKDFLADLDAGILAHRADDETARQMQKKMRGELLSDIPPAQRGKFKDVPIEVVSDAEFERLSRKAGGQAAVVFEGGRARVLLRESADPKILREQGANLLAQSADPKTARFFQRPGEAKLAAKAAKAAKKTEEAELRQLSKEMRGELFSAIPPGQRGKFKNVRIDIIDEETWQRFGRSAKGQAMVIIENGRPRVLLRQGADLRALREEGIHLLQTVDPKLSHLFKHLDEARLANWHSLGVNDRIIAVTAKLDIEIDAQRKLLKNLNEALAEAGDDPAVVNALRKQIDAAEANLKNLHGISDDVSRLTPAERLSISKGGPPRKAYLEEPPRLFSKKDVPRPKRADPNAYRFEITNSKLGKDGKLQPGEKVYQIGDTWKEEGRFKRKGKGGKEEWFDEERVYRQVEIIGADKKVKFVREEIQMPDGSWVKRGSDSAKAGTAAEDASRTLTARRAVRAKAKGKTIISLGEESQHGSGQGFDEVFFEFDASGRAKVVIVEVKDYPGRQVPFEDFTAITKNMGDNYDRLQKQIENELLLPVQKRTLGLTQSQLEAVSDALDAKNVSLELRLGATTQLGSFTSGSIIKKIKNEWGGLGFNPRVPVEVTTINRQLIDEAVVDGVKVAERDMIGTVPKFYKVTAAAESAGAVKGPFKPGGGDMFVDAGGKLATTRTVKEADIVGKARDELAAEIVERLSKPIKHPHGAGQAPLTMLLDVSALSPKARQELQAAIEQVVARTKKEKSLLNRLHQITGVP